jgi:subtilisin family serine protease
MLGLSGCGGGGGGVNPTPAPPVSVTPTPAPAPTPTPTPTPSPTATFQTNEYDRAIGLGLAKVITAYQAGATGRGVTAAVIDSGVDPSSAEFAGRISPASQDLSGSRGIGDEGGHGTAVSAVLLAAKNDSGIHGVAFDATLLSLRTDTPGSCNTNGDCSHSDNAIARALDVAIAQGAKVANLSLGGSGANTTLRAAIGRATAAGMVIVMSAGNDGAASPSALALVATDASARGQIIVAGAHDPSRAISSFSNRAGQTAGVFVTALGEGVRSFDENGTPLVYSGTSFSAPFVSGAVALLAQAFPNLTGAQIVQLLLESADDLGEAGTDPVYGRGALNIGRAFQPRNGASLPGSQVAVDLNGDSATLSPAMGDAAQKGMGAIILDGFDRAFAIDLARTVRNASPQSSLTGTLSRSNRGASLSAGGTTVAVSIADTPGGAAVRRLSLAPADAVRARATAGMIASRIDARTSIALGFGQSRDSLAGQLAGRAEPAFLVARGSTDGLGFDRRDQSSAAVRHMIGRIGVTAGVESGEGLLHTRSRIARDAYLRSPYSLLSIGADRRFGSLRFTGGLTRLQEERTLLGARFGGVFGANGGNSWFADMSADWSFGKGWRLGASARQGWSVPAGGGLLTERAAILSNAFSFDVGKAGLFSRGDLFGLRLSQPLRVSSGGLSVRLPVGYDYGTAQASFADQRFNLAPEGRELALEASYSRMFFGGRIDTNLFWRQDPGHFAAAPDDLGAALRWRTEF